MSRIEQRFQALKEEGRSALVTFIMAGDPDYVRCLDVLKSLPEAGADIIELGMPFSDPAADGEIIQFAGQRALKAGTKMRHILQMVTEFRVGDADTPIILMGYANPIYTYGLGEFSRDAREAGVDGLIIVDLPPEEDAPLQKVAKAEGLDIIRLVTPTADEARLKVILEGASGFLYYVSITGVTGAAVANTQELKPHIEMIKSATDLPVAIGFGIKTPEDAVSMGKIGDGVVVGSAIVDKIKNIGDNGENVKTVLELVGSLSNALRV
ncbi:MAG: tryptophan synthase subunit alpha [Alphaproteobacteria bacterium]|nr:tryptophan synthase subunit alpha [Alphaproteobacteria bacterium]